MIELKRANEQEIKYYVENRNLVPMNEITNRIKEIDQIDAEIKRLKEQRSLTKDEINDLVLSVDVFGLELEAFVSNAYWTMDHIRVNSLRALVRQRIGGDKNWHKIIAGIAVVACRECGKKFQKKYKSKTQYNDDIKHSYGRICTDCEARSKAENERQRQKHQQNIQDEVARLRDLPYAEYLQTDHWQAARKRALKRARFKCQLCSSNGKLHVHHRIYKNLGNENNSDLIVLCEECHGKFHDKISEAAE